MKSKYYKSIYSGLTKKQKLLIDAASDYEMEQVMRLLNEGVNLQTTDKHNKVVEIRDEYGVTALQLIAGVGTLAEFKAVLNYGTWNIDAVDKYGQTVLHFASYNKNLEVLKFLIDNYNFDINAVSENYGTPLHYAVTIKNNTLIELLLNNGADLLKENTDAKTPLQIIECNSEVRIFLSRLSSERLETFLCESFLMSAEYECAEIARNNFHLFNLNERAKIIMGDREAIYEIIKNKNYEACYINY